MAKLDEKKVQLARESQGTDIRQNDDGDWVLFYKYDGTVIEKCKTAEDAFRVQKGKPKKPGPRPKDD